MGDTPTNVQTREISDDEQLVPNPLVSVLMLAFNHAPYLGEAIEGVLAQRCDFQFELIIGEDASSDETLRIALDYQRRYPGIIRVVHSQANVGARDNIRRILARARGEYVAWCEGDDYWCSPEKLARQLALIHGHPDVGVVHSDWVKAYPGRSGWTVDWNRPMHRRVPLGLLQGSLFRVFHNPKILRTCTRLARRSAVLQCIHSPLGQGRYRFGDAVLAGFLTSGWKVAYLPEVTAVYRLSPRSALRSGKRSRIEFLKSSLAFDSDARHFFEDRRDYPAAYRWELDVGLFLWGISVADPPTIVLALKDLRSHFTMAGFFTAAWKTLCMRRPALVARSYHREPGPPIVEDNCNAARLGKR